MPKVSSEAIQAFDAGFQQCMKTVGGGKVVIDITCVRELMRGNPEVAYGTVENYCFMAQSQPGYLQLAFSIALAYQKEFNDDILSKIVIERAEALGAQRHLEGVEFLRDLEEVRTEAPERTAAKAWWQASEKKEERCDNCSHPLRRGEGYLLRGQATMTGEELHGPSEKLICQMCFYHLRSRGLLNAGHAQQSEEKLGVYR